MSQNGRVVLILGLTTCGVIIASMGTIVEIRGKEFGHFYFYIISMFQLGMFFYSEGNSKKLFGWLYF